MRTGVAWERLLDLVCYRQMTFWVFPRWHCLKHGEIEVLRRYTKLCYKNAELFSWEVNIWNQEYESALDCHFVTISPIWETNVNYSYVSPEKFYLWIPIFLLGERGYQHNSLSSQHLFNKKGLVAAQKNECKSMCEIIF